MLRLDATDPWIRWDWLGHHTDVIWQALVQHIQLTGIAVLGGLAIATPVGLLVWRWRALRNPVLSVAGILYTIPSLALFALLGEGGLGQLILAGLIQDFKTPLVVGLAGSVVLAVAADLLLAGAQRLATPWRSSR